MTDNTEPTGQRRLIGWRSADYTMETADMAQAQNWSANIKVLPVFEGDPNTRLSAQPAAEEEALVWLSKDDAQLALFQAIRAIKIGNPTDDKLILANLREAGLWIGRYEAAPVAAAQEAVAWQVGDDFYTSESLAIEGIQQWGPSGSIAIPLYAAPVAAAQAVPNGKLVGWWNGITPDITERSPYGPSVRWGANAEDRAHDIPLYDGYNPVHYQQPTHAAPGIDLPTPRNREEAMALAKLALAYLGVVDAHIDAAILRCETDASPKGGIEPVATLTIGEAGEEGTQPYFLDRIRETEAFGNLKPGTYQLAVCSMQATSAEVGS